MIGMTLPLMVAGLLQMQETLPATPPPAGTDNTRTTPPGDEPSPPPAGPQAGPAAPPVDADAPATGTDAAAFGDPIGNDVRMPSRWFVRVGALDAPYNAHARIVSNGARLPGASVSVSDSKTAVFDIGYDITDNVSVMFVGGVPPKADVTGTGTVAPYGYFGSVRFGPVMMTAVYRLPEWKRFRPYVGAGVAHLFILKEYDGALKNLKVHDNNGFVLQAGVEYRLNRKWALFADYKRMWINVRAEGELGGAPIRARVFLDPDMLSTGVKFHF